MKVHSLALGSIAAFSLATSAFAADLPVRGPAPSPIIMAPFSWAGFYVGAQIGYGWADSSHSLYRFDGLFYSTTPTDPKGILGGLHAGYNWQFNQFVMGLEVDGELKDVKVTSGIAGLGFGGNTVASKSDYQGSIRARVGYSFDQALVYLTGGATFAHFKQTFSALPLIDTPSDGRWGWTMGGGVEYAFSSNWSARLEYRYTDFGTERVNLPNFLVPPGYSRNDVSEQSVRAGVSYRFGGAASAVMARY